MQFIQTKVIGSWVVEPHSHLDNRGRFMRAWCVREFSSNGIEFVPLQANLASSLRKGTIRGLHYQDIPSLEAKLVRCTRGVIFDVVLDLRPNSPSFGEWHGEQLSAENGRMLYVPELCAHGYQTLCDDTEMYYMTSAFYDPSAVRGVRYDDPVFNIAWPLGDTVVSEQDGNWPLRSSRGNT
jgi:dTDP-4-dehydrorhamnose 3,5-epimerase